jgi:hypothetical protein
MRLSHRPGFHRRGERLLWLLAVVLAVAACGDDDGTVVPGPCNQCEVFIPASRDNTLYEPDGNRSNGVGSEMFIGLSGLTPPYIRRALVAFDVRAYVPSGATVDSVRLSVTMITGAIIPSRVRLYRVLDDWGEGASNADGLPGGAQAAPGDATWTARLWPDSLWSLPGGDFVAVPSGSTDVAGAIVEYVFNTTPQMVADVQAWLDDPASNFGWLIRGNENAAVPGSLKSFATHQNPETGRRPQLQVFYRTSP